MKDIILKNIDINSLCGKFSKFYPYKTTYNLVIHISTGLIWAL